MERNMVVKMKTIELTEEELAAFKQIFEDNELWEYFSYSESGKLCQDAYSSLCSKLGISLTIETSVDFGEEDASTNT